MKSKLLKRLLSVMLVGTAVFSLAACSGANGEKEQPEMQTEESTKTQEMEENTDAGETADIEEGTDTAAGEGTALIAYFSWSGNTEAVAQEIQAQTGADLFEIVPAEPYTDDYNELLDIAQEEQSSDARPAIAETVDLSGYDTVYLGFPNWWGDMPMILYTFLDEYDLSGKTIAPFNTSGGSGFSGSLDTIAEMEPEAEITEGLSLGDGEAEDCTDEVAEWLADIGMTGEGDS